MSGAIAPRPRNRSAGMRVPEFDHMIHGLDDAALDPAAWDGLVAKPCAAFDAAGGLCEAVLNELGTGILVVDGRGIVMLANRAAEAFAAAFGGLALVANNKHRAVAAATPEETQRLRRLIARAAPAGAAAPSGGSMQLRTVVAARGYAVTATPLPRGAWELHRGTKPLALLLITDLNAAARPPERQLCEIFGLTPAEARLAAQLAQGKTRTQYADETGIAVVTAQTHLRRAFSKLGINRESELVRLVLSL